MTRRSLAVSVMAVLALTACSGSDGVDDTDTDTETDIDIDTNTDTETDTDVDDAPSLGGIDGPAVVDPSFDPFATDPSAPPDTDGG